MTDPQLLEIVRNFPENGLKRLLEDPDNLRDVFTLDQYPHLRALDFARLELDRTTYIQPDFRHVLTDLVYRLPFRGRGVEALTVYLLLEHQSEPDEWTSLWLLGYLSAIYLGQHRAASARGLVTADWRLQPVLPLVLYTGNRSWDRLRPLSELIAGAQPFLPHLPNFAPRFVNIDRLTEQEIEQRSTGFGHILWLLRHRQKRTGFAEMLARTVRRLEPLLKTRRRRWLELLSYLHALAYHGWEAPQREELQSVIRESVRSEAARQEVRHMGKTIAEDLMDQGRAEGALQSRREILLRLLRQKFRSLPEEVAEVVQHTTDVARLDRWLDQVVKARRLADVKIPTAR